MSEVGLGREAGIAAFARTPFFWLGLVALGLGAVVYGPLFFPPTPQTLSIQSEEFFFEANEAAGAPVLVLSLWLFYRRSHYRDVLLGPGTPAAGLGVMGAALALFAWGHYTQAPDLQLASIVPLLFGVALALGGMAAVRAFWLPILFLAFALPLSPVLLSAVMYPIQLVTAQYAGAILNTIGVTSSVRGDQILRPETRFIVIETCSGVRTIVTLTMLTVLLIDLFERRGWHALLLMLLAPVVAFLTNGLRVVTLVLNPHSSIHSIHNLQGIAMLLVGLTAMYLIDGLLERILGSRDPLVESGDYGTREARPRAEAGRAGVLGSGAAVVCLLAMIGLSQALTPYPAPTGLDRMPDELLVETYGERQSQRLEPDYQFRGSVRYLAHANRVTRIAGEPVEVFLGVANEQLRPFTMLSKRLAWPESGYEPLEEARVELDADAPGVDGGDPPTARRMLLRRGARTVLSYSWTERDRGLAVEFLRHALALDRSPFHRPAHMLAIRISTPVGRSPRALEQAEARVREAWRRLAPELPGYARIRGGS